MKQLRGPGIIFAAVTILCLTLSPSAGAAESFGVGARPANPRADNPRTRSIFVYELAPGATASDAVIVANNTDQKKTVKIYGVDSQVSSDGAFACAQEVDAKKSVGSWISLAQSEVTIEPGKTTKVPFTITMPASVDVGEHNGCIAVQATDAVTPRDQNGISLSFRSALRVAITVPGDLKSDLTTESVKYNIAKDKLIVTSSFKNVGNVSVDTQITTELRTLFGTPVDTIKGTFLVLRDAKGTFNFETQRPFWGGYYTLATSASYKPLSVDAVSRSANDISQTIFIMPHPTALLIEGIIAAVVIGGVVWIVLRKRRRIEQMKFSRHHSVKANENIQTIGEDYDVSWKLVARVNHLKPPYALKTGQKILIPGTPKVHKKH